MALFLAADFSFVILRPNSSDPISWRKGGENLADEKRELYRELTGEWFRNHEKYNEIAFVVFND